MHAHTLIEVQKFEKYIDVITIVDGRELFRIPLEGFKVAVNEDLKKYRRFEEK